MLGDIQLVSGRLEIFYNGTWGTVCDDSFDDIDAQVACRQLGYNNGFFIGSFTKYTEGKIWLDDVDCSGAENKLSHCTHAGWGVENCFRGENVKIQCNNASEGTCQLGYSNGSVLVNTIATGFSKIWLNILACNGGESKLIECSHTDWGTHTCSHGNVVGIRCVGEQETEESLEGLIDEKTLKRSKGTSGSENPPSRRQRRPIGIHFLLGKSPDKPESRDELELQSYLLEKSDFNKSPLEWLSDYNEVKYPRLSIIAKRF
ncbi:unnamed protein product [Mytilus coruscus]|uniref:SRCR domain-containing protein n=1 Tax=Mytilus coruscus TaxID=42192 RepID=A0A6J8AHK6_MYTCO|nr:unnamed protein product [Mytilus coruscus]